MTVANNRPVVEGLKAAAVKLALAAIAVAILFPLVGVLGQRYGSGVRFVALVAALIIAYLVVGVAANWLLGEGNA